MLVPNRGTTVDRRPLRRVLSGALGLAALLLLAPPTRAQEVDLRALDGRVEALREAWDVPGLALAVVRAGSILRARGYGVREVGRPGAVDGETIFAVGSATKAFTSTALAVQVGRGALGWDDRVVEHLPGFTLSDPWLTRTITLRDLLAHRSGLPMANEMWLSGQLGADELVRRLRHLEPEAGFRSRLSYQNVLYLVAGRVLAQSAGLPWAEFVRRGILDPLGMDRTRTGVDGLESVGNVASPHAPVDGELRPVPYRDIDAVGPAGSLLSSAEGMARWLRFQLADGRAEGDRLVDRQALLETRRPQILMRPEGPLSVFYPEARRLAYAMGWVASDYRGRTMLDHGGGIDGMTAVVAMVPEERLGVAVLTNRQAPVPPYWLLYPLLDLLLGHEPVDRSATFRALAERARQATEATPERLPDAPPSRPLEAYTGRYESPPLGEARVTLADGRLSLEMGRLSSPLEPWHLETFRAPWHDRAWRAAAGPGWVTFRLDRRGRLAEFELEVAPGERWTFRRVEE